MSLIGKGNKSLLETHGYLFAVIVVLVSTIAFYPGRDYFAKGQWPLLYLLIIVFVASLCGYKPALVAALLSFLACNYFFITPYHTFRIDDPKDWLLLVVFLSVGVLTGLQTGKLREREIEAVLREKEKQLQALAALHEADRIKSTLTSSVSHELMTPLASVTATITNLLEKDTKWEVSHVLEELLAVKDDLDRLNTSICSLVDLSRLESNAWMPKKDYYELGEIISNAIAKIPDKKRNRITVIIPKDLPDIKVDFIQWSRVFQHLLENSISYSGEDSNVKISASSNDDEIIMWIEDEGPGILEEEINLIFDKFYRGKISSEISPGTGLGLAIAREIVNFHGGKIWVENCLPHGAKFIISLLGKEE